MRISSDLRSMSCCSNVSSFDSESISSECVESYIKDRSKREFHSGFQTIEFGTPGTLQYRMLFLDDMGREISPLNDVPLFLDNGRLNFVCQTPRGAWVEYEVARDEYANPLRIMNLNGRPSHYAENMPWKYGIVPQTSFRFSAQRSKGDSSEVFPRGSGAPLEALEIGESTFHTGEIYPVKVLGSYAVIDIHANLTWKLIVIAANDPLADKLNSVDDVEVEMPGILSRMREWLRNCHYVDLRSKGKLYGLNEKPASPDNTMGIITKAHSTWQSAHGGERRNEFAIPLKAPISVYQAFWRTYTDKYSSEQIPLSDSLCASFRYEKAWVELYSPRATERSYSPSVQCNCYNMIPISRKTVILSKPKRRSADLKVKPQKTLPL